MVVKIKVNLFLETAKFISNFIALQINFLTLKYFLGLILLSLSIS